MDIESCLVVAAMTPVRPAAVVARLGYSAGRLG